MGSIYITSDYSWSHEWQLEVAMEIHILVHAHSFFIINSVSPLRAQHFTFKS